MAHGQWSEVEARGVLSALARSGLSIERFAKDRGITPQRIYWWKKKLVPKATASPMALLPVRVVDTPPPPTIGEPILVLLRNGHMVKLAHGFDESAFVRAMALMEQR